MSQYHTALKLLAAAPYKGTPRPLQPVEWYGADPTHMERRDEPTGERGRAKFKRPGQREVEVTPDVKLRWLQLYGQGTPVREIARTEGVSKYTVQRVLTEDKTTTISVQFGSRTWNRIDEARGDENRNRFIRDLLDSGVREWYSRAASRNVESPLPEWIQRWIRMWFEGWAFSQIEEAEGFGFTEGTIRKYVLADPKAKREMARREKETREKEKAKPTTKTQPKRKVRLSLGLPSSLKEALDQEAEAQAVSRNNLIEMIVNTELNRMQRAAAVDLCRTGAYYRYACGWRSNEYVVAGAHRTSA